MAFGTKNKGRSDTDNYMRNLAEGSRASSDMAIGKAAAPDPLEERRRTRALALDKWANGESGPIDVRDMPGGGVNLALFEDAKKVNDAGRMGRGVGSMSGNANPNYVAKLNQENEMRRHEMASGALEGSVNDALNFNNAEMGNLTNIGNARNMNIANLQEGRYENERDRELRYLLRPKQENFFKTLAAQWLSPKGVTAAAAL